jgi:hypothetical protein
MSAGTLTSMSPGSHSSGRGHGTRSAARSARGRRESAGARGPRTAAERLRFPRFGDNPGDRLVAAGVVLFVVGLVATIAVFLPFMLKGVRESGLVLGLATFLTVLGLGAALIGLYRQTRASRW